MNLIGDDEDVAAHLAQVDLELVACEGVVRRDEERKLDATRSDRCGKASDPLAPACLTAVTRDRFDPKASSLFYPLLDEAHERSEDHDR